MIVDEPLTEEELASIEAKAKLARVSVPAIGEPDNRTDAKRYEDALTNACVASDLRFITEIRRLRFENAMLHKHNQDLAPLSRQNVAAMKALEEENAAMRVVVAAFVQGDGTPTQTIDYDGPVGALCNFCEGGIREKAGYIKFEHNNGDVSWHEPNCPAVVAVGLMERMKDA